MDSSSIEPIQDKFKFKVSISSSQETFKKEPKTVWMEILDLP
jgi:hypothetical protein